MVKRSEQEIVRFNKLSKLRENGFRFPNDVKITSYAKDILSMEDFPAETEASRHTMAGRITQKRLMGKAGFCHILDKSGKVQLYFKKDILGDDQFETFSEYDLGDIIEVKGYPFITKTGEKSLFVESTRLLTKALLPLPEKWHGLTDIEQRYRYRYVDLISSPEVREVFKIRAKIISYIRSFFDARDYIEVETPVLHYLAGGATARPFLTHYNALHNDMLLRIALELPLKKLVVGGLDRVYEIGRVFRNEGLSKKHNPEFTMLEFYQAYSTYEDLMTLSEELLCSLVTSLKGTTKIKYGENEIDFKAPWKRVSMHESLKVIGNIPHDIDLFNLQSLLKIAEHENVKISEPNDWGRVVEELWGNLVEHKIIDPTFITHHPFSISPLARKNLDNPLLTDRFEIICSGMEIGNAFSELNDAEDQRERFEEQLRRKEKGDKEANDLDEDFLKALEHGLPPTAGQGIGIDRLVMLLTDSASIRDVVLFPHLKPLENDEEELK